MLEWLIVGGGVQGTYLSHVLVTERGVAREAVRVVDPHPEPLRRWDDCTENSGMRVLRSPYVHHIDTHPFSLRQYSRTPEGRRRGELVGFYRRPTLDLFRGHSAQVIEAHGLQALRLLGRVRALRRTGGAWEVETEWETLRSRRVLLAISASEQPEWPGWAQRVRGEGAAVDHVFEPGFRTASLPDRGGIVVIGAGITGVQVALTLAERSPGTVTLLTRHPMRVEQFDAAPGWIGPRYMRAFLSHRDPVRRREMITTARNRGSMPPDVAASLRSAIAGGKLRFRQVAVHDARCLEGGACRLELDGGDHLEADRVLLATGFDRRRPGGSWLDGVIEQEGLPCAPCGYPRVDRALRWADGLLVTGALAELELGPVARNIVGARSAADRLRAIA